MADSTCVVAPLPSIRTPERRRKQDAGRRDRVRREAVSGLRDRAVEAVIERVYQGSPGRLTRPGVAVAHITFQTALAVAGMWEERRPITQGEAATFRMVGGLAARAGVSEKAALAAMDAGWELVLSQARRGTKGGMWTLRDGTATAREFDRKAHAFAELIAPELLAGLAAETGFVRDQEYVMLGALDGTLDGAELQAAASAAGLVPERPYRLALIVSPVGRSTDVDGTASAVRELVPHVLDLGLGDRLPRHRRVVIPELTSAQWVAARNALHDIGARHRALVIAPSAAPSLAALRATYEQTAESLRRTIASCCQWYGVVDPARLVCEATPPMLAVKARACRRRQHADVATSQQDQKRMLVHLLAGRVAKDELGAAASSAGLDASREHGLVLLVHPGGATIPLARAAHDIEATIPNSVDLGLSHRLPMSRRLVFPVVTHGRWIEARTSIHNIATKHGVLAIAPVAAPTLARLAATYRETEQDLARVMAGCGYASGIIDPACVGPACEAEGTSPAPDETWAVEPLPASVA